MKNLITKFCIFAIAALSFATAATAQKVDKEVVTIELLSDLHCHSCATKIMNTLPYKKGVKDVTVDVDSKVITVQFDTTKSTTEEIITHLSKIKINAELTDKKQ